MPKPKHPTAPTPDATASPWPALVAASLIAVPALLPLVVGFLPELYLTTDPRAADPGEVLTHFGPAGAAVWQTLSIAGGVLALAIYTARGGRLIKPWFALAGLGVLAAVWHGTQHAENLLPAGAWIAGVVLALAAVHVGRLPRARCWMSAVVIAMMVPVGLQAGYDVLVQKPRDIAWWDANEADILEQHRIEPSSAQHKLLQRRAHSPDATGPFGFSNALGTLAGGGALLALFTAVGYAGKRQPRAAGALACCATAGALGLTAVWMTHSTGAQLAVVIAAASALAAWPLAKTRLRRLLPVFALLLVAVPIAVVLARGAAGPPESDAGERSLLFRYHYWQASARVVEDQLPASALTGVGLADYKYQSLRLKNPINPENVDSAHSAFIDWVTMLGIGGLAWCVLALCWFWHAGLLATRCDVVPDALPPPAGCYGDKSLLRRPPVLAAAGCATIIFGVQYALQAPKMDPELALIWLAGLIGFIVVASTIGMAPRPGGRWLRLGLFAMAGVVLIHSQIEMAFRLLATAGTAWFLIGLAAAGDNTAAVPARAAGSSPSRTAGIMGLGGVFLALIVVWIVAPVVAHQRLLQRADQALRAHQPYRALAALEDADQLQPTHPAAGHWIAILRRDEMLALLKQGEQQAARQALQLAVAPLDRMIYHGGAPPSTYRDRATILSQAADAFNDAALRRQAIEDYRELRARSPYSLTDAVTFAELLDQLGERPEAVAEYRRALALDRGYYLDPGVQLDEPTRQRVEAALARLLAQDLDG